LKSNARRRQHDFEAAVEGEHHDATQAVHGAACSFRARRTDVDARRDSDNEIAMIAADRC
jgi:hypothetical protein